MRKLNSAGVSPLIGTILLIAVTVALAAVVATLVIGLGGRGAPPFAYFTVTAKVNADNNEYIDLRITHGGGDDLKVEDLRISATTENGTIQFDFPGTGIFRVDEIRTTTYFFGAPVPDNQLIDVSIIHWPSRWRIQFSPCKVDLE